MHMLVGGIHEEGSEHFVRRTDVLEAEKNG